MISTVTASAISGKLPVGDHDSKPALNTLMTQVLAPFNLQTAWKRVRSNKGAAGVDSVTIEAYPEWAKQHWSATRRALERGYYIPQPIRRVEIPKASGGSRQLGIPTVNDRVIQQAIAQVLTPIIDPTFSEFSYGFRPNRSAHDAVRQVQTYIKENRKVAVDIDLSKFFDRVEHDILMHKLSAHIRDKDLMKLIGRYLRADIEVDGRLQPSRQGVPQGGPLSPLLANVMLDTLDKYLESRKLNFSRYADDFVICVKSSSAANRVLKHVRKFLDTKLKLPINTEKSKVVKVRYLNFLSFIFVGKKIRWSDKALQDFKYNIRRLTKRSWGISMQRRYRELVWYIRGWTNYFALSEYYRPLPGLDQWIRRRLRMCYLKQWRKARTRVRKLMQLGCTKESAVYLGASQKGYYRLAKTLATHSGMGNKWFEQQGLVSVRDLWIKFHYGS